MFLYVLNIFGAHIYCTCTLFFIDKNEILSGGNGCTSKLKVGGILSLVCSIAIEYTSLHKVLKTS